MQGKKGICKFIAGLSKARTPNLGVGEFLTAKTYRFGEQPLLSPFLLYVHIENQKEAKANSRDDTCVIRTHAPEGTALAGQRVNHSAKVPGQSVTVAMIG